MYVFHVSKKRKNVVVFINCLMKRGGEVEGAIEVGLRVAYTRVL